MKRKPINRYIILTAAALCGLIVGAALTWSIFKNPLMAKHNWTSNAVTLAYSLYMLFACIGTFLCPVLQRRVRLSVLMLIGGCMHGLAFFFAGMVHSVALLYLTYSLLGGLGNGLIYNTAISVATKWFPEKKGFANGVCVGSMGLASLVFAPMGNYLIENYDVSVAFGFIGLLMIIVFLIVSWFIRTPDQGWVPAGFSDKQVNYSCKTDLGWRELIHLPSFYCMWLMLLCAVTVGTMITSHAAAMAQNCSGVTAAQASTVVAILAAANFTGRLFFASLSDKLGRFPLMICLLLVTACDMLLLFSKATTYTSFLAGLCIAGACYGGIMATLPGMVSDAYGQRYFSTNYACIYSGFTCASFVGPLVASNMLQATGSYSPAITIAGYISVIGILLAFITNKLVKKNNSTIPFT